VKPKSLLLTFALTTFVVVASACSREPEITCKVNDQCFVCPDAKARAACVRDPTSSRCKWAEPSHCR